MKRYVKEFITEQIAKYEKAWKTGGAILAVNKQVELERILKACERGFCTDYEAVKMAVDVCEK